METFRYARSLKWIAAAAFAVFLTLAVGFAGLAVFGGAHVVQSLISAAVCGWLVRIVYHLRARVGDVISVDGEGIAVEHGSSRRQFTWSDVADVRPRAFNRSLVLYDADGRPLLEIAREITSFDRLRERILAHTGRHSTSPEATLRPCPRTLLMVLAAGILAFVAYQQLHLARTYEPLPPPASTIDDSPLRQPVLQPADPFDDPPVTVDDAARGSTAPVAEIRGAGGTGQNGARPNAARQFTAKQ